MRILSVLIRLGFCAAIPLAWAAGPASAQTRFDYPTTDGLPVDHCESLGTNCGQGGANMFCRAQGFDGAQTWNTYNPGRSITLGSRERCDSGYCTAFREVTCVNSAEVTPERGERRGRNARTETYSYPSVSGLYIDHCETFGSNCGRGGAEIFCRSQGFERSKSWKTFDAGRTVVLGSQRECDTGNCTGFSEVVCTDEPRRAETRRDRNRGRDTARGERVYARPTVRGLAVDHCRTFGRNCGKGGADQFCRSEGFDGAASWRTYNPGATYVIGSRRRCDGAVCTGLRDVLCRNAPPRRTDPDRPYRDTRPAERTYDFPAVRGVPIDHCVRPGRSCGQGGANLFCREQGYDRARTWSTYAARRTYVLGARRLCDSGNCTGLSTVTCTSAPVEQRRRTDPYRSDRYQTDPYRRTVPVEPYDDLRWGDDRRLQPYRYQPQ